MAEIGALHRLITAETGTARHVRAIGCEIAAVHASLVGHLVTADAEDVRL
jgi:hypothetical protein